MFDPITKEQQECIEQDLNLDQDTVKGKTEQVKDWMKKQPHFPHIPEQFAEKLIKSCLVGTKLSVERTKYKLDTFYAMRHQLPEIFLHMDPTHCDIRDSVRMIKYCLLSELTPEGFRVHISCFSGDGSKKFTSKDLQGYYKRILAVHVARVMQEELSRGSYIVYDARGFHLSHLTELPWPLIHRFNTFLQESLPVRVQRVFVINAPKYVETLMNILKPVLKQKIKDRIQIFEGDHTNLYKYIPRRILPSDYGGEAPSLQEYSDSWQKTAVSMRDFLVEDGKRMTEESKRPTDQANNYYELFGVNGSFTKLNID